MREISSTALRSKLKRSKGKWHETSEKEKEKRKKKEQRRKNETAHIKHQSRNVNIARHGGVGSARRENSHSAGIRSLKANSPRRLSSGGENQAQ